MKNFSVDKFKKKGQKTFKTVKKMHAQASYERIWAAPVNLKGPNSSVLETPVEKTLFMIARK